MTASSMNPVPPRRETRNDAAHLAWSDDMLVGHGAIDETHREFVDLVNELRRCLPEDATRQLLRLKEHVLSHFEKEEQLMRQFNYPSPDCHSDEHAKVVHAIDQVLQRLQTGLLALSGVHRLAQALMDWFPGHITYMDSALSAWLSKQRFSAAPIVLRRGAARHEEQTAHSGV